jgi:hypothetical protein
MKRLLRLILAAEPALFPAITVAALAALLLLLAHL